MEKIVLKDEILDTIKSDPVLFGGVAKAVGVSVYTLPKLIKENDPRLTQANVLKVIADHLGEQDSSQFLETQELFSH